MGGGLWCLDPVEGVSSASVSVPLGSWNKYINSKDQSLVTYIVFLCTHKN